MVKACFYGAKSDKMRLNKTEAQQETLMLFQMKLQGNLGSKFGLQRA